MIKVAVVIVTYNRVNLLEKTINAVLRQTVNPEIIYIINNSSTDKTIEVCEKISFLSNIKINLINKKVNDGGAGGFADGLEFFLQNDDVNYCWMMDDDVEPDADCLENLLAYTSFSDFIHPSRYYEDGREQGWRQIYMPSLGYSVSLKCSDDYDVYATNVGCFEGCLISKKIVNKLGIPFRDFFIAEDDTLYGFLASFSTPVLLVNKAKMKRLIKPNNIIPAWKIFYIIRNKIWMLKIIHRKEFLGKVNYFTNIYGLLLFIVFIMKYNKFNGFFKIIKGVKDGVFKNPDILKK